MSDVQAKRIKDFAAQDFIEGGFFAVRRRELKEYIKGTYVRCELGDCTGRVEGVVWEPDTFCLTDLAEGMVVKVRATVGEYRGKKQLTISKIRLANPDEYRLEDILPSSEQTREERFARVRSLTDKLQNGYIRSLVESFWCDQEFTESYLRATAGMLWHHAYLGGLSEHSCNVAELALRAAQGYDFLCKDYLIFGGLFHDAGKIRSYDITTFIEESDEGRLVNHISVTDQWVVGRASKIDGFPEALLIKLRHLILAHHGERANGSPVVPMMPEAFVLYYCDEIDSKMGAIARYRSRQKAPGWSEYVKLLDRYLYLHADGEAGEDGDRS